MEPRNPAASEYRRLEYIGAVNPAVPANERNLSKTWNVTGDHLTIHTILGGAPVYAQLSGDEQDGNPFIRVREGMILTRKFKKITFRIGNSRTWTANAAILGAKVIAFTSTGPLFANIPPKEYGLRRGFFALYDLEATTANTELAQLIGASGGEDFPTFGKGGGSLTITNTDLANDLYLLPFFGNMQTVASGTRGYGPLRPGQSITLQLEDVITYEASAPDAGGLVVKTLSGSCKFSVIGSGGEMDDVDGEQSHEHHQAMK